MKRDIPTWLPFALLAFALLALFHRLLSGQVLFWGLPSLQFYPWRHFAFDELHSGQLPGWNPYLGAGAPLIANYQSAIFYPPNWLFLLLPNGPAMSVIALGHVIWAAIGLWQFTGVLGIQPFGRAISALSYALSSYTIGRFGSFTTADAAAWIPWIFWLAHLTLIQRRWSNIGWLGLAFGLQLLAGHAQTTWYSGLGVGLYVLWQIARGMPTRTRSYRLAALLRFATGMILGIVLASIQIVLTVEYLQESQRSGGMDFDTVTSLSYHPLRLITLLSPHFFGTPADGSYITEGIFFEDAAYIGFIPFISALAAIGGRIRRRQYLMHFPAFQTVYFWVLLGLGALLVALGNYSPLYHLLYDYIPTFKSFREPVRWLILTVFSLSILAGIGTQNWGRGKWIVFWSRLSVAGGGTMVIMALVGQQFLDQDSKALDVLASGMVVLGCWVVVAALFTLTQPDRASLISPVLWRTSVLLFVAIDLAWANSGLNPTVPSDFYSREFGVSQPEGGGRIYWFEDYEQEIKYDKLFDVKDYRKARDQWPDVRTSRLSNLNMLNNVYSLNNFDPFVPEYYQRYLDLIEDLGTRSNSLLRMAAVTEVYGKTPRGWQDVVPSISPDTAQYAWLVSEVEWLDSDSAIEDRLRDPDWDPQQIAFLAGESPDMPVSLSQGTVTIIERRSDRLHLDVRANGPAYLVISSTWYPGWTATVDGQDAPIYRTNLAFPAVALPPGGAEVVLRFSPRHWDLAAGVSALGLLLIFALITLGNLTIGRRIPRPED